MKLKEAQLLGILALIAIGVILLCMWGGEDEPDVARTAWDNAAGTQQASTDAELDQLLYELTAAGPTSVLGQQDTSPADYTIEIGARLPGPPAGVNEQAAIRSTIEVTAPERLVLTPPEGLAEEPKPQPPRTIIHTVEKGETLSSISRKSYGTPAKWGKIQEANKDAVPDPQRLMPGTRLVIPVPALARASGTPETSTPMLAASAARETGRVHTVAKGETLWRIALKYYDDGPRCKEILAANRALISEATDLQAGMKLQIP